MLQPMSIILAKLITAMTKEGKFKDAIQDKIGATVDTTDLKKTVICIKCKSSSGRDY
ncbi:MAG: hypothetical protein ACLR0W_02385 [Lachnospira sp.]